MALIIGLVKDESARYDGYNWHDEYARHFIELGDQPVFLDFKAEDWLAQVKKTNADLLLWRAWHVPDDRDDAKNKIYFLDKVLGVKIFPDWNMYQSYDNKISQLFLMHQLHLPHPRTFYSRDIDEITQFVANAPLPIVSKSSEGACGDNVRLIKERSELEKHVAEIFSDKGLQTYFPWIKQKGYVYFQEYISVDRDLRIITIGDKVELAFWRENPNSWKKNIAGGGKINPEEIPESAKQLASDLAVKTGFHWCASDMLMKEEVPYLLEFSSVFGFSRAGNYEKYFESPNAFILKKQAAYLHKLFTNESKK